MRHIKLTDLYEALLDTSEDILVAAKSKHHALYHDKKGSAHFLGGDFSGTEEEREAEVRRIMKDAA
jgi:hypothetical protein